jgi:hypothetical protein
MTVFQTELLNGNSSVVYRQDFLSYAVGGSVAYKQDL